MMLAVAGISLKTHFAPFTVLNTLTFSLESDKQTVQIFVSCGTMHIRIFMHSNVQLVLAVFIPILFNTFKTTFAIYFSEDNLISKLNKQEKIV